MCLLLCSCPKEPARPAEAASKESAVLYPFRVEARTPVFGPASFSSEAGQAGRQRGKVRPHSATRESGLDGWRELRGAAGHAASPKTGESMLFSAVSGRTGK